jgi:hypothetical protein
MSTTEKTAKQWLQDLPLQKRLQAMENVRRDSYQFQGSLNMKTMSLYSALSGLFTWADSRQGHAYWSEISEQDFNVKNK